MTTLFRQDDFALHLLPISRRRSGDESYKEVVDTSALGHRLKEWAAVAGLHYQSGYQRRKFLTTTEKKTIDKYLREAAPLCSSFLRDVGGKVVFRWLDNTSGSVERRFRVDVACGPEGYWETLCSGSI